MRTDIVNDCIGKALDNEKVRKAIEKREKHPKVRISEVRGKVVKRKNNSSVRGVVVRVGFDFELKEEDMQIKEDIKVDVIYIYNKKSGEESYKVNNPISIPEIE